MGFCGRVLFVVLAVVAGYTFQTYRKYTKPLPVPDFDAERYWGPGKAVKDDTKIVPFKIEFKPEALAKLQSQLSDTTGLVPPLEDSRFHYGFNSNKLEQVIKYWRDTYLGKWTERQKFLNQYPQFTTQIQGLKIHYIHVVPKPKSASTKVLPLLLLHGWPGSVREFYELIPLLTTEAKDRDFVFEVIVPSLPGYGFSQAAAKTGYNMEEMAVTFRNLMLRLGKNRFYVQGGDWGSGIGEALATYFPKNVIGFHANMCAAFTPIGVVKNLIAETFPSYFVDPKYYDWYFPGSKVFIELLKESGYMHIQATKPDTIGTALAHNPIGLAVYILEKFSTWTNPSYRDLADGGLEKYFTLDSLLDNLMFYYIPNSITTSQRLYKESLSEKPVFDLERVPTTVPFACAKFRYELAHSVNWILEDKWKNIVQTNHFEDGGHFAAFQLPKVLAQDVFEFVAKVEQLA